MSGQGSTAELLVCTKCRGQDDASDAQSRLGETFYAQLIDGGVPDGVRVKPVECLSNCTQGCSIALCGPGRWSYVYGRLDPAEHTQIVLQGAALYQQSADGLVPWRERPEHFRKNCIARIPPIDPPSIDTPSSEA